MNHAPHPTPHPAVNALLAELLPGVRALFGPRLVGFYLDGSLALGDFDADSDVDFVAVLEAEVTGAEFLALQALHDRLAALENPWAVQLEGSYLSAGALRRHDPANARHPNLERGLGERLKWADHGADWNVHRYVLREHGLVLAGPPPAALVDPVAPGDLRAAALSALRGWAAGFLDDPGPLRSRGYQSYVVLSLCRVLYTLERGAVASKPAAAQWARAALGETWAGLIDRAWVGRQHPQGEPLAADVDATLAFIRLALAAQSGSETPAAPG